MSAYTTQKNALLAGSLSPILSRIVMICMDNFSISLTNPSVANPLKSKNDWYYFRDFI